VELGRFRAILNAYGAAPERWPEDERMDALALTRASVAAARELADARKLDNVLSAAATSAFEIDRLAVLQHRIVSAAHPMMQSWTWRWFGFNLTPMQLWPSVAGLALATILGFAVGINGVLQTETYHDTDDVLALSSIDPPIGGQ
jgi:hypothetical protein